MAHIVLADDGIVFDGNSIREGPLGGVESAVTYVTEALVRRGIDPAAHDPWVFPTVAEFRRTLEAHGFVVSVIELFPRPTPIPCDIDGWLDTFAQPFLTAVDPEDRSALIVEVRDALAPRLRDAEGAWTVDYVRLRFAAALA